jgi:hypothetical protein
MLDTLKLSLTDYEISPDANLDVQPSTLNFATGEVRGNFPLFRRGVGFVQGAKAFHNADDFNVSVQPFSPSQPQSIGCQVQFSVPKLANGSNYEPADFAATEAALVTIECELASIGITTNIKTARLSRLDACRSVRTSEPYQAYAPVLARLQGQRVAKRDYGTTFLWHNTVQEVCVYDKREEMKRRKKNLARVPRNVVRFEHRLLKARKVRDVLGFGTAGDLLQGFDQVAVGYKAAMEKQLFRDSPKEIAISTAADFEAQLTVLIGDLGNRQNRPNFVDCYVRAVGFRQLVADKEAFLRAVENVSENRMTLWRTRKKLREMEIDALALEQIAPSKHTLGELYRELEREVLSD